MQLLLDHIARPETPGLKVPLGSKVLSEKQKEKFDLDVFGTVVSLSSNIRACLLDFESLFWVSCLFFGLRAGLLGFDSVFQFATLCSGPLACHLVFSMSSRFEFV